MNVEDQIREDLHRSPVPAGLLARTDLADAVLSDLRRQRRNRVLVAVAAAVAIVVAVGVPVAQSQIRIGAGYEPAGPNFEYPVVEFPTPGGGPQAIHAYTTEIEAPPHYVSYLLDEATGEYQEFPYEQLVLSPDRRTVAFDAGGRIGLADRAELLAGGESAARWLDLQPGSGLAWSPDGTALLLTTLAKGEATVAFTAQRYDLATGTITPTPINVDLLGSSVGWAADSRRYLALLRGDQGTDTVEPGALQYIEPDGTLGETVEIEGGLVGGADSYSPSRRYLLVDSSQLMSAGTVASKVIEVSTGEVVRELPGGRASTVGWYDETTVVTVRDDPGGGNFGVLELVDVGNGEMIRQIELAGVPYLYTEPKIQVGPSDRLTGRAEAYGF